MNFCYLLCTDKGQTYIGATVDLDKRLRQHNGQISGGAKATGIRVAQGLNWKRICYISNIPDWRSALQIEWRWKQLGRTLFKHIKNPIQRRLYSLKKLLELEKPTKNGIPYDAYPEGLRPVIIWDLTEFESIFNEISV
jgi:structure-specific endonuclease subunit SLX1